MKCSDGGRIILHEARPLSLNLIEQPPVHSGHYAIICIAVGGCTRHCLVFSWLLSS